MHERIIMAGSGGQGILLIGKLLATVALKEVPHITFFPAYGAEVRGGVSSCEVVLSSREISSPVSETFDGMLLMSQDAVRTFSSRIKPDGMLLVNATICRKPSGMNTLMIPAAEQATRLGDVRTANFIMLGAYLACRPLITASRLEEGIRTFFSERAADIADMNIRAFRLGLGLGQHAKRRTRHG